MRETAIKDTILRWLREQGFYATKIHGESMQDRGLPDIFACVEGRYVAIEVKQPGGVVSRLQEYHLDQIAKAGGVALIARSLEWVQRQIKKLVESEATGEIMDYREGRWTED